MLWASPIVTRANIAVRMTPGMAAGVVESLWTGVTLWKWWKRERSD
jgi:hypothetical protein